MASHTSGRSDDDDTLWIVIIFGLFAIIAVAVFLPKAQHMYYSGVYFQYRGLEHVLPKSVLEKSGISDDRRAIARSLRKGAGNYDVDAISTHASTAKIVYGGMTFCLFLFLWIVIWVSRPEKHTTPLGMEGIDLHVIKRYWQNAPVIGRHLDLRHPFEDKLWRYSRSPWVFAYENGILTDSKGSLLKVDYEQMEVYMIKPTDAEREDRIFHTKVAQKTFSKQLGKRISIDSVEDVLKLPIEHKALIVPLLTQIDGFYEDAVGISDVWLKQYAMSFIDSKMVAKSIFDKKYLDKLPPFKSSTINMKGVDDALRKAFEIPTAKEHLLHSGYDNALLVQLMNKTIVMKSSYFKWLKPVTRNLWYGMNNVGRPGTKHVEGAGLNCHAEYELVSERKEYAPQVDRAVTGLRQMLKEYYWMN